MVRRSESRMQALSPDWIPRCASGDPPGVVGRGDRAGSFAAPMWVALVLSAAAGEAVLRPGQNVDLSPGVRGGFGELTGLAVGRGSAGAYGRDGKRSRVLERAGKWSRVSMPVRGMFDCFGRSGKLCRAGGASSGRTTPDRRLLPSVAGRPLRVVGRGLRVTLVSAAFFLILCFFHCFSCHKTLGPMNCSARGVRRTFSASARPALPGPPAGVPLRQVRLRRQARGRARGPHDVVRRRVRPGATGGPGEAHAPARLEVQAPVARAGGHLFAEEVGV